MFKVSAVEYDDPESGGRINDLPPGVFFFAIDRHDVEGCFYLGVGGIVCWFEDCRICFDASDVAIPSGRYTALCQPKFERSWPRKLFVRDLKEKDVFQCDEVYQEILIVVEHGDDDTTLCRELNCKGGYVAVPRGMACRRVKTVTFAVVAP